MDTCGAALRLAGAATHGRFLASGLQLHRLSTRCTLKPPGRLRGLVDAGNGSGLSVLDLGDMPGALGQRARHPRANPRPRARAPYTLALLTTPQRPVLVPTTSSPHAVWTHVLVRLARTQRTQKIAEDFFEPRPDSQHPPLAGARLGRHRTGGGRRAAAHSVRPHDMDQARCSERRGGVSGTHLDAGTSLGRSTYAWGT